MLGWRGIVLVTLVFAAIENSANGIREGGDTPLAPTPLRDSDFVSAKGIDLMVGGKPFRFAGTNCYYVTYQDTFMVDDVLETAANHGFSVVCPYLFAHSDLHHNPLTSARVGSGADLGVH